MLILCGMRMMRMLSGFIVFTRKITLDACRSINTERSRSFLEWWFSFWALHAIFTWYVRTGVPWRLLFAASVIIISEFGAIGTVFSRGLRTGMSGGCWTYIWAFGVRPWMITCARSSRTIRTWFSTLVWGWLTGMIRAEVFFQDTTVWDGRFIFEDKILSLGRTAWWSGFRVVNFCLYSFYILLT